MVSKKSRPRRSAEETRRVLVAEGLRQLELVGMDFGVEHLTLEAACVTTNVPRSSSHAAWAIDDDYSPQALYQRSVLKEWLEKREGVIFAQSAQTSIAKAFEERGDQMDRYELARVATQAALEAGLLADEDGGGSGLLSTDMAIKHTLASQPASGRDPEIVEWVRASEVGNRAARVEDSYRPLAELMGMQPRAEYGDEAFGHIALALATLVEGVTMREVNLPELNVARKPIRDVPEGEAPVTLLGACVEALIDKFFEPVEPDAEASDS